MLADWRIRNAPPKPRKAPQGPRAPSAKPAPAPSGPKATAHDTGPVPEWAAGFVVR